MIFNFASDDNNQLVFFAFKRGEVLPIRYRFVGGIIENLLTGIRAEYLWPRSVITGTPLTARELWMNGIGATAATILKAQEEYAEHYGERVYIAFRDRFTFAQTVWLTLTAGDKIRILEEAREAGIILDVPQLDIQIDAQEAGQVPAPEPVNAIRGIEQLLVGLERHVVPPARQRQEEGRGEYYDLIRAYQGTYVKHGVDKWVYIVDRGNVRSELLVQGLTREGNLFSGPLPINELSLDTHLTGAYNSSGMVLNITRSGQRQWRKGICHDTYKIRTMFPTLLSIYNSILLQKAALTSASYSKMGFIELNDIPHTLGILDKIEDGYPTITEAILRLDEYNHLSVAISRNFWLSHSLTDYTKLLYYGALCIGKISDSRIELSVPLFAQEVSDFIRNTNTDMEVYCG